MEQCLPGAALDPEHWHLADTISQAQKALQQVLAPGLILQIRLSNGWQPAQHGEKLASDVCATNATASKLY